MFSVRLLGTLNHSLRYLKFQSSQLSVRSLHSVSKLVSPCVEKTKSAVRNLPDVLDAPCPAIFYGISGLIPFTTIPAIMVTSGTYIPELAYANLVYSAVILSFLGGVRWGSAITEVNKSYISAFYF